MKKGNMNLDQKKRLILIVICSVALLILVLLAFYFISHGRKTEQVDANQGKKLQGVYIVDDFIFEGVRHTISGERCTEGNVICIRDFEIIYNGSKGIIKYKIANHSTSTVSGHIKINIGKESFVSTYQNVSGNGEVISYFGYDGYTFDFDNLTDFSIEYATGSDLETVYENLSDEEKSQYQDNR